MAAFGQATANEPSDLILCDQAPFDGTETFDLTVTIPEIIGSQNPANYTVTYFETLSDAQNNTNQLVSPTSYTNIVNPQSIYARITNVNNNDFDTTSFTISVLETPNVFAPSPLVVCDDNDDGFADFDLTSKDPEITNGDPNLSVTYHESLGDAINGINQLASPYMNIEAFLQIIYIRVQDLSTACVTLIDMDIIVNEKPTSNQPYNLFVNEGDGDGFATFNLTVNEEVIQGDLLEGVVQYFETQQDAAQLFNPIAAPTSYVNSTNPQTIYVALQNIETGCYDASKAFKIATDGPVPLTDGDNDGVPDTIEDVNSNGDLTDDDTDDDGTPNFQDNDDDGDDTLTIDEDYNNNGSPTDDDRNENRIPDYLDENVTLGVDSFLESAITLYPNPTQNNVYLQWNADITVTGISVYGMDGKIILSNSISNGSHRTVVNLSAAANGIYFIKISTQKGDATKKIIKK